MHLPIVEIGYLVGFRFAVSLCNPFPSFQHFAMRSDPSAQIDNTKTEVTVLANLIEENVHTATHQSAQMSDL